MVEICGSCLSYPLAYQNLVNICAFYNFKVQNVDMVKKQFLSISLKTCIDVFCPYNKPIYHLLLLLKRTVQTQVCQFFRAVIATLMP